MKMAWLLLLCISWIGCAAGGRNFSQADSRTAVTPSSVSAPADRNHEEYRERLDQLDAKIAILKRQMARLEGSSLELLEGFQDLKKSLVGLKPANSVPATTTVTPAQKEEVRLPSLPVLAGKNKPWSQQDRGMASEIIQQLKTASSANADSQKQELIGSPMPVMRFINSNGEILDLKDYQGKKNVLLIILRGFAGSVCLACSSQTVALSDNLEEFRKRNTEVILVYPGDAETVPGFLEAVQNLQEGLVLPFPITLDVGLNLVNTLRIRGDLAKPTSIIMDRQGIVRYAYVGRTITDRPPVKVLLEELGKFQE